MGLIVTGICTATFISSGYGTDNINTSKTQYYQEYNVGTSVTGNAQVY